MRLKPFPMRTLFPVYRFSGFARAVAGSLLSLGLGVGATGVESQEASVGNSFYIREFRIFGSQKVARMEAEEAVYSFLGPGRTEQDVEQARAALEKLYQDKGYQAASVEVPPQRAQGGVVVLQVREGTVGALRVKGARYFLPSQVQAMARSLAEGKVLNFNDITRDIVALNQLPERQVTPALRPGMEPGTVDIDLNVQDKLPLHASAELNNRYSPDTSSLRLNLSASYHNLWQLGHTLGASFQTAPEKPDEVKVLSGYYLFRVPGLESVSWMIQGIKQDSNVSTLGSLAVAGRGEILGGHAIITLPSTQTFFHSMNLGFDYKNFNQDINSAGVTIPTPITYYPVSAAYSATWMTPGQVTELNANLVLHFRGLGSDGQEFDESRFKADGSFIYLRGDLARTQDLPWGLQLFGKAQGQISDQPLVNSEQFAGGGLSTARGYLEGETLGDNALFGSIELRSPSLLNRWAAQGNEWRFYAFADAGFLTLQDPLPEQESEFRLASVGFGSRLRLMDHLNGSIDMGLPLIGQSTTRVHSPLFTFRFWADF